MFSAIACFFNCHDYIYTTKKRRKCIECHIIEVLMKDDPPLDWDDIYELPDYFWIRIERHDKNKSRRWHSKEQ